MSTPRNPRARPHRVDVYLTEEERNLLDDERGRVSRTDFLRRAMHEFIAARRARGIQPDTRRDKAAQDEFPWQRTPAPDGFRPILPTIPADTPEPTLEDLSKVAGVGEEEDK